VTLAIRSRATSRSVGDRTLRVFIDVPLGAALRQSRNVSADVETWAGHYSVSSDNNDRLHVLRRPHVVKLLEAVPESVRSKVLLSLEQQFFRGRAAVPITHAKPVTLVVSGTNVAQAVSMISAALQQPAVEKVLGPSLRGSIFGSGSQRIIGFNWNISLMRNPLSPEAAARAIVAAGGVRPMKLFNYDATSIAALQSAGITHVSVSVPNVNLPQLNASTSFAAGVCQVLKPFIDAGMQFQVMVGNEPLASWYNGAYHPILSNCVANMITAIRTEGLSGSVKVTVPFQVGVLSNSYPPSAGTFDPRDASVIASVAQQLVATGSSFDVNIYPYFAINDVNNLNFVLGNEGNTVDGVTYSCLLDQQAAAVRAALLKLNSSYTEETLPICIGECGWPTNGDHGADPEATPANAATFLQNCIEKSTYSIFFFEAFDEQLKAQTGANGTSSLKENYFGWLNEAGQKKYNVPALEGTPGPTPTGPTRSPAPPAGPTRSPAPPAGQCDTDYTQWPECQGRMNWMEQNWNRPQYIANYQAAGVDGTPCSIQKYLNEEGPYCPACSCGSSSPPTAAPTPAPDPGPAPADQCDSGSGNKANGVWSYDDPACARGGLGCNGNNTCRYCKTPAAASSVPWWTCPPGVGPGSPEPAPGPAPTPAPPSPTSSPSPTPTPPGPTVGPTPPAQCDRDFAQWPTCQNRINWMLQNWNNPQYTSHGVDGSECSIQKYLNENEGPYCPPCSCAPSPTPPRPTSDALKVMSYNLMGWNTLAQNPNLTPALVNDIRSFGPDVLGAQECEGRAWNVAQQTGMRLAGTERHGVAICYNPSTIELQDSGTFDLPEQDHWGTRICAWAQFKHKQSDRVFYHYNTHWCLCDQTKLLHCAQTIAQRMATHRQFPAVLTGDFNVDSHGGTYDQSKGIRYLTGVTVDGSRSPLPLQDAYHAFTGNGVYGDGVTTFPGKGGRIDFILSSALTVTNATIMQRSTSDHNAITATFGF